MAASVRGAGATLKPSCQEGSFCVQRSTTHLSSVSVRARTPIPQPVRQRAANCTQSRRQLLIHCVSASEVGPSQMRGSPEESVSGLPLKEIPGGYGLPFFGAYKDKLDFYWFQKLPQFYESRRDKYNSTVYRTNVPPGPPFFPDPRVIVLLDEKSYPVLFDMSKVDKKDTFTGTYVPSLKLTGGYRVLAYMDPSEPKHTVLKQFAMEVAKMSAPRAVSALADAMADTFALWDAKMKTDGKVDIVGDMRPGTFKFVVQAFTGVDPLAAGENKIDPSMSLLWMLSQIAEITIVPAPWYLAPLIELALHTFEMPSLFVKNQYSKIINFFKLYGAEALDCAEKQFGLDRDEALHNFAFIVVLNAWGGIDLLFPCILRRLGATSAEFQNELAAEVRQAVAKHGGKLSPKALAEMPLVVSTVREVLRIDSPVPYQYARAKKDFVLESHDAAYQIRKGEMLAGYMLTATRDPKVFRDPLTFDPKRFMGEEGEALLKYVLWSNGPETEGPSVDNKQCPGKNFSFSAACLFVATLYTKYDVLGGDDSVLTTLQPAS